MIFPVQIYDYYIPFFVISAEDLHVYSERKTWLKIFHEEHGDESGNSKD